MSYSGKPEKREPFLSRRWMLSYSCGDGRRDFQCRVCDSAVGGAEAAHVLVDGGGFGDWGTLRPRKETFRVFLSRQVLYWDLPFDKHPQYL